MNASGLMSAFGRKADVANSARMPANDPKRAPRANHDVRIDFIEVGNDRSGRLSDQSESQIRILATRCSMQLDDWNLSARAKPVIIVLEFQAELLVVHP